MQNLSLSLLPLTHVCLSAYGGSLARRLKDHVVEHLDHPDDLFVLLADKYRTFTVPGSMMDCDARHFRVGFGAFPEELKQGLQNFDDALAELMP
jgi:hypothetical protein